MKRVFVAFCGGCKPEIDRKHLLQEVQELLPDYCFQSVVEEANSACCSLILNGCPTECRTPDFKGNPNCISVRGEMIVNTRVTEESLAGEVVKMIEACGAAPSQAGSTRLLTTKGLQLMKEIRIHGRGGQGGVTAASIIGGAAVTDGKYAQAFPAFGTERRGAPVLAFCRISDSDIRNRSQVYNPDIVVVLDEGLLSMVDVSAGLKPNGTIIINSDKNASSFQFKTPAKVVTVDATSISLNVLGRPIVNTTILGTLCAATGAIQLNPLKQVMRETFGGELGEKNVKAMEKAYEQCKEGA